MGREGNSKATIRHSRGLTEGNRSSHVSSRNIRMTPFKVSLIYAVVGASWIFLTDAITGVMFGEDWVLTGIQMAKGIVYIAVTSILVYWLVCRARQGVEIDFHQKQRQERNQLFKATLASLGEAVMIVDPDDRGIIECNPAAERIFGYTRGEILGKSTEMLHMDRQSFEEFGACSEPAVEEHGVFEGRFRMKRKDGRVIDTQHTVRAIDERIGWTNGVVSIVRDITDLVRSEKFREARLTAGRILLQSSSSEDAVPVLLETICRTANWDLAELWSGEIEREELFLKGAWHKGDDDLQRFADNSSACTFSPKEGIPGRIWHSGSPEQFQNITSMLDHGRREFARDAGLEGAIAVPVQADDVVKGVLICYTRGALEPQKEMDGFLEDISGQLALFLAREKADAEVKRRRDILESILAGMADGLIVMDTERRCLHANRTAEMIYAEELADIPASQWASYFGLYHTDGETLFEEDELPLVQALKGNPADNVEVRVRSERINNRWLIMSARPLRNEQGSVWAAVLVWRDITERVMAAHAAEEKEERIRLLLESTSEGIVGFDEDACCSFANPAAAKLLGYEPADEMLGCKMGDMVKVVPANEKSPSADECPVAEAFRTGVDVHVENKLMVRLDGRRFHAEIWCRPVRKKGAIVGVVTTFLDISRRLEAEAKYRRAQKLETAGQLTSGIAHDFNNLLAVIVGNLDLLRDEITGRKEAEELLEAAFAASESGTALTKRLLAFSRRQNLQAGKADINSLVENTVALIKRTIGERITVDVSVKPELPMAWIDVDQFESALLNLAVNARDAMPEGGTLTIETTDTVLDEEYARLHNDVKPGAYLLVTVSDTGCGMDEDTREHALQPFFSTKKEEKGTGLGLSMVYGFIRQSGGHLNVYSELGEGTVIRMYLPYAGNNRKTPSPAGSTRQAGTGRGENRTILVVEDKPGVRQIVLRQLESLGYQTVEAEDAATALEVLKGGANVDLLFTDVVMPGEMDGMDLAETVRRQWPGIPVLFTSGYTERSRLGAGSLSHIELLSKPYRKADLAAALSRALSRTGY